MIIAIDGPAGAGKSTTARAVAACFGFAYIDTGAMYRAVALTCCEQGLRVGEDDEQIGAIAGELPIVLQENGRRVLIGERDISEEIRTPQIGEMTSQISTIPLVREAMVRQQRILARRGAGETGGAVLEGRDIQTVVFPDAEVKIFLTASAAARATRRLSEWQTKGQQVTEDQAVHDIVSRDERDSQREASPLRAADDAIHIDTSELTPEQVVARIAQIVQERSQHRPLAAQPATSS
jgi:cytidylate kinase